MSLVNDMLRDLDSRQRDGARSAVPREKLIPAADQRRKSEAKSRVSKWVLPLLIVVIAAGGVQFWRMQQVQQGAAVVPQPLAETPASVVVEQPAPVAAPVAEPQIDPALLAEMERMSQRMQELEERNIALQQQLVQSATAALGEATQVAVSQADAIALEPGEVDMPASAAVPAAAVAVQPAPALNDTGLAAPAVAGAVMETPVQAGLAPDAVPQDAAAADASSLVRMPTQMNFRELDRQQVQQALVLWQQGQQGGALALLRDFAAANPAAHQSREMLAKLMLQQGDMIGAMEQADIGLGIQQDHYGYKKVKARVLMAAGVPAEAAELLALRAPSLASDSEYHELLAASRLASQKYDEALVSYEALAASAPQDARWWYGVAASQDALGRSFEAVQSYERALQLPGLTPALRQNSQQRIASIRQN